MGARKEAERQKQRETACKGDAERGGDGDRGKGCE